MGASAERSSALLPVLAAVALAIALAVPIGIVLLLGADTCGEGGASAAEPSGQAREGIPANYLRLYRGAGDKYGVPWTLLAAIGSVETDHGRLDAPGVRNGQNTNGCCAGPMQFHNNYGSGGGTWGRFAVDGDRNGRKNIYDPKDAIPAAARYLKASGAPRDLESAIFAYNRAGWYVQKVLAQMRAYGGASPDSLATADNAAAGGGCADMGGLVANGEPGEFRIAPGANAPGRPLSRNLIVFVGLMAGAYDDDLVLTTGTNHSTYSASGGVSDHASGNGADFGMVLNGGTNDGPVGDRIAASAFLAAGLPREEAISRARAGGAQTIVTNGIRVQIIWKSDVGGNHHNHVHVGLGTSG